MSTPGGSAFLFELSSSPLDTTSGGEVVAAAGISSALWNGFIIPGTFGFDYNGAPASNVMRLVVSDTNQNYFGKNASGQSFKVERGNVATNFTLATNFVDGDSFEFHLDFANDQIRAFINSVEDANSPWVMNGTSGLEWTPGDLNIGQQISGSLFWDGTISNALDL